ncbi:MAG: hypothetical protein ACRD3O_06265, partial [Terriglobia bacterium]
AVFVLRQDSPLPPACLDRLADRHPPIVPAAFRKLDAVAVLTAESRGEPTQGPSPWTKHANQILSKINCAKTPSNALNNH